MSKNVRMKSADSVIRRITAMVNAADAHKISGMIDALIKNRDQRITYLNTKVQDRILLITQNVIIGALKSTIDKHGPITMDNISSAAKRIIGQIHVPAGTEVKDENRNGGHER